MIKIYSNRSVHPNQITISNQYENKTRYIEFDLSEIPQGNRYLIVSQNEKSYAFLLGKDGTFEVTSALTWNPGKVYYANIVVSNVLINDKIESTSALFVSDTINMYVSKNYINADSLAEQPLPKELQIVYDDLLNLKKEIETKLANGDFNGKDGVGIKSIEKTKSEGLVDTYTITLTDNSTFEYVVTNGLDGQNGKSAYQIAVDNGFQGTEEEWLKSLDYEHSEEFTRLANQVRSDAEQSAQNAQSASQSASQSATSAEQASKSATSSQGSASAANQSATQASQSAESASQYSALAEQSKQDAEQSAMEALSSANTAKEQADKAQSIADSLDPLKFAVKESAEGNPVVISDGADYENQGMELYGQSEQKIERNVIPFPYESGDSLTTNGITFTVKEDKSIHVVGTSIGTASYNVFGKFGMSEYPSIPSGLLRGCPKNLNCELRYVSDTLQTLTDTGDGVNLSGEKYTGKGYIEFRIFDGSTVDFIFTPELLISEISIEYPSDIISKEVSEIKFNNTNILPNVSYNETKNGVTLDYKDGIITLNGTSTAKSDIYIPIDFVLKKGTYVNLFETNILNDSNNQIRVALNNSDGDIIPAEWYGNANGAWNGIKSFEITEDKAIKYVIITIIKGSFSDNYVKYGINVGTSPMPYEPYKEKIVQLSQPIVLRGIQVNSGGNITIDGQQYISDYIDSNTGKVVRKIVEVDEKNMKIEAYSGYPYIRGYTDFTPNTDLNIDFKSLCSISNSYLKTWNNDSTHFFLQKEGQKIVVILDVNKYPTDEDIQAVLNKGIKVVFAIEETIEEDLPEADQEAIRALKTFYPNTVIDTGCFTKVNYVADTKLYIDKKLSEKGIVLESRIQALEKKAIGG